LISTATKSTATSSPPSVAVFLTPADNIFKTYDTDGFFIPPDFVHTNLMVRDFDHDYQRTDNILTKYFQATFDQHDPRSFKPTERVRQMIEATFQKPNYYTIPPKESSEIWKNRYFYIDKKQALTKVLKCSFYDTTAKEVETLLKEWAKIDYDDAIYLLSRDFSLNPYYGVKDTESIKPSDREQIRAYAISILNTVDAEKLGKSLIKKCS
jgi:hypothetical protein